METLMQALAVVAICGGLLSLYWFVEKYDRMVRHWRETCLYVDREPDMQAYKRDYVP